VTPILLLYAQNGLTPQRLGETLAQQGFQAGAGYRFWQDFLQGFLCVHPTSADHLIERAELSTKGAHSASTQFSPLRQQPLRSQLAGPVSGRPLVPEDLLRQTGFLFTPSLVWASGPLRQP
jgi:hypothetical protein